MNATAQPARVPRERLNRHPYSRPARIPDRLSSALKGIEWTTMMLESRGVEVHTEEMKAGALRCTLIDTYAKLTAKQPELYIKNLRELKNGDALMLEKLSAWLTAQYFELDEKIYSGR